MVERCLKVGFKCTFINKLKFPLKLCIILPVKVFQFKNHYLELSLSMVPLSKEINRDGY